MIVMSKMLKEYVQGFDTKEAFCEKYEISYPTFLSYMNEKVSVSNDFIERITKSTGWVFEKAFDVREDKP